MKKLIQKSTVVLFILSLFVVSCEKPKPGPLALLSDVTYKNAKGQMVTVTGNVEDGCPGVITITTSRHGEVGDVNCKGTWSYEVKPAPTASSQDPDTGKVVVLIQKPGTYVVTITFTSCTGAVSSTKVSITVK